MEELEKILNKKNMVSIREYLATFHHADIAEYMEKLDSKKQLLLFKSLETKDQSHLFSFLTLNLQKEIVKLFSNQEVKELVDAMYTEDAVDLVEDLPSSLAFKVLQMLSPTRRKEVNQILNYSDDVVGSIMYADIITFKKSWTIARALKEIRSNLNEIHFSKYFYVVNQQNKLVGCVKIKDIIFEEKSTKLSNFIKVVTSVKTTTKKEVATQIFAKYNMPSLPVINSNNEVIGIIDSDSVIDVIQEETNEDFQVMAGIKVTEEPYSKTKIFKLFKSRIKWLLLLMVSSTLSQAILDLFLNFAGSKLNEDTGHIAVVGITSALVAILPVISGAAGNAGSQSSTTIIRSLATGDISTKDYLRVFYKEVQASTLIGIILGVANFIRLTFYYYISGNINESKYLFLSLAASVSLIIVIILAQIVGGMLPLVAKTFKIDPAVMAAPVLTTLIDTISIVIFFSISIGIMVLVI